MGSKVKNINARVWLRQNGYPDVADLIDSFVEFKKSKGSGERRNYWDLLTGRQDGEPFVRNGFVFPILESVRAARKPDYKPSPKAIKRNDDEKVPLPREQTKWRKEPPQTI